MESVVYIVLAPFFLIPSVIFIFAIVEVIAKRKAANLLRRFEEEAMDHPKKEAKRIVRMVYRMYGNTGIRSEFAIGQFHALVSKLEEAIRHRSIRDRDAAVISLAKLLQGRGKVVSSAAELSRTYYHDFAPLCGKSG